MSKCKCGEFRFDQAADGQHCRSGRRNHSAAASHRVVVVVVVSTSCSSTPTATRALLGLTAGIVLQMILIIFKCLQTPFRHPLALIYHRCCRSQLFQHPLGIPHELIIDTTCLKCAATIPCHPIGSTISIIKPMATPSTNSSAMQSRERSEKTSQGRSQEVQLSEARQGVDNEPAEDPNAEEKGVNGG